MANARTVLVTGAAGNLGQAVARRFLAGGDHVIVVDRDAAALARVWADTPAHPLALDLLDRDQVRSGIAGAAQSLGPVTVLCNIAGGFRMGEAVHETTEGNWNFMLDINARTVIHACAAVVPGMLQAGRGSIVNIASAAALKGGARMSAYSASKSVVMRLTESMAAELGPKGINANCVLPTTMDTPENRAAMPKADHSAWASLDDVANVVAFLASEGARAVHGAAVTVGR